MIERSKNNNKILILEDGKEVVKSKDELFAQMDVEGFIRIRESEYKGINNKKKGLAIFNLEYTDHKVGKRYALVKIIRQGSYNIINGLEVLPLLSLENLYIVECVDVKNNLKYEDLTPEYFIYSLPNIQNIEELKPAIWNRYSASMPNLSKEEMENLGVGYTLLKFENK